MGRKEVRLLSIDWDFFFPRPSPEEDKEFLYDWGQAETGPFMLDGIWVVRAASFITAGKPLPLTSGEEDRFWGRFRFRPAPVLYYADSHSLIYKPEVLYKVREVFNFDAHHDACEGKHSLLRNGRVRCDNWATALSIHGISIWTVYPQWASHMLEDVPKVEVHPDVDRGHAHRHEFDKVFVCRSGAWTPTWIEDKFWQFIGACPIKARVKLDNMEKRTFNMEEAQKMSNAITEATNDNRTKDL
jgi:hypothetical protein